MTSQSPRIYLYKITFEEVPYYYYGVHKEKRYNEYYMGSPVTHKWCWELYTPKKQILEVFEYSDKGWLEANLVEDRLIKPFYNTDKWCLNESCGGIISLEVRRKTGKICGKISGKKSKDLGLGIHGLTPEQRRENGKKGGKKVKELGLGFHGRTEEQMTEDGIKGGKIGGKITKELGLGIHGLTPEQTIENARNAGKIGGKKTKEFGIGVHGRTKKQMSEDGRKGGKKIKELGLGIFGLTAEQATKNSIKGGKIGGKKSKDLGLGIHGRTKEQMTEDGKKGGKIGGKIGGKKTNSQKWMCLETGFISTPAGISNYQRARGIDTSKKVRIS